MTIQKPVAATTPASALDTPLTEPEAANARQDGLLPIETLPAQSPQSGRQFTFPDKLPDDPAMLTRALADPAAVALRVIVQAESGTNKPFHDGLDWRGYAEELRSSSAKLRKNDLSHVEDMLMHQASALQAVFVKLMERGLATDDRSSLDLLLRYGLRAQSQCRATLETLANVKNPPIVYARQANVTTGPQQVNNGVAHAGNGTGSQQSKLSKEHHELRADTRASALESRDDSPMAPLGTVDGTANRRRQGQGGAQSVEGRGAGGSSKPRARTSRASRRPGES